MVKIGTTPTGFYDYSWGVNDANEVTGQIYDGQIVHAFLWSPTTSLRLLPPLPGGLHSVANAINNLNEIVGTASTASGTWDAMIWKNAKTGEQDLLHFPLGSYTAATSINDSSEVVGWGYTNSDQTTSSGFYWAPGAGKHILSSLGGDQVFAEGINASGNIAGYTTMAGDSATHAVLWTNYSSAPTDLGTLPGGSSSYARAVNNVGQVAGYADVP
jgi:probable HAF family extracellular repeat protein